MQDIQDINDHLKSLDELIAKLGGEDEGVQSAGPCTLLVEHLEAARRELIGAMPTEYAHSLRQASESIGCIPGRGLRVEFARALRGLIDAKAPAGSLNLARSEPLPR